MNIWNFKNITLREQVHKLDQTLALLSIQSIYFAINSKFYCWSQATTIVLHRIHGVCIELKEWCFVRVSSMNYSLFLEVNEIWIDFSKYENFCCPKRKKHYNIFPLWQQLKNVARNVKMLLKRIMDVFQSSSVRALLIV